MPFGERHPSWLRRQPVFVKAEHSIRNTTIAVGKNTIYFIDKPITHTDDYRSRIRGKVDPEKLKAKAARLAKLRGTAVEAELEKQRR